jgi:SAM-dependent methyltransferase
MAGRGCTVSSGKRSYRSRKNVDRQFSASLKRSYLLPPPIVGTTLNTHNLLKHPAGRGILGSEKIRLLHQRQKDILFAGIAKAAFPNFLLHRAWHAFRQDVSPMHLHLGCGPIYLRGFVNIDANFVNRVDLWLDVRNGLPYRSNSIDSIYSTHMFEHFFDGELRRLLRECFRVLKSGAGIRLIVPNLGSAIQAYVEHNSAWFADSFPHHFGSLGGRFSNFVFCDGQHRTAFDFTYLSEVLRNAGFGRVIESREGQSLIYGSGVPLYDPADSAELAHSLYVEAFKA